MPACTRPLTGTDASDPIDAPSFDVRSIIPDGARADAPGTDAPGDARNDVLSIDAPSDAPPDTPGCTAASCDDGDPCTDDVCEADGTCAHQSAPAGTICGPGNPALCREQRCTETGTCASYALCRGARIECCGDGTCCVIDTR